MALERIEKCVYALYFYVKNKFNYINIEMDIDKIILLLYNQNQTGGSK